LTDPMLERRRPRLVLVATAALLGVHAQAVAQTGGPNTTPPITNPPIDLTGYWVSVVTTTEWRLRMVTPAKGDFLGVRMTPAGLKIADAWDPAKDEAAGDQCKSYGAAGVMRIPGRIHITWQDEKTLRMDLDAGIQTRLFQFEGGKALAGQATWQGHSVAQWDASGTGGLKVITKNMRAGYLRKNGIPYSENAVLTEYFDVVRERTGDRWLIVTSVVEDPLYLQQPYTTSVQFKKQPNASGWDPTPCSSSW
jgi:hypothetical protein